MRWVSEWSLRSKFRLMAGALSAAFVIAVIAIHATIDIRDTVSTARERITSEAAAAQDAAGKALDYDPVALGTLDVLRQYPGVLSVTLYDQAGRARGAPLSKPARQVSRYNV